MKADSVMQREKNISPKNYKKIMSKIEFMQKYLEDPDIFIPDSVSFKNFLIQSFCYLHPDFHYLSFLNKEDIDTEIIKVSSILQILPTSIKKKCVKLFNNMSNDEVHKFWLKFFSLFKNERNNSISDLIFDMSWQNKHINFFKDMKSTLDYLNYELPVVDESRFSNINIEKEIDTWKAQVGSTDDTAVESTSFNYDEMETTDVNIEKLIIDLKQIVSLYNNIISIKEESKPEHIDFFNNLINLTENVLQYRNNLIIINSVLLDEFNSKMLLDNENLSENLYFLKRCNNFIKTLNLKVKALFY